MPPRVCPDARALAYRQNKLDRDALSIITVPGSALYQADMAAPIKEHFADVVDPAVGEDPAEEPDEEDDEDSDEE